MNSSFIFLNSTLPKSMDAIDFVSSYCSKTVSHNVILLWFIFSMVFIVTVILNIFWVLDQRSLRLNGKSIFRVVVHSKKYNIYSGWSCFEVFQLGIYRLALLWVMLASAVLLMSNGYFSWFINIIHFVLGVI